MCAAANLLQENAKTKATILLFGRLYIVYPLSHLLSNFPATFPPIFPIIIDKIRITCLQPVRQVETVADKYDSSHHNFPCFSSNKIRYSFNRRQSNRSFFMITIGRQKQTRRKIRDKGWISRHSSARAAERKVLLLLLDIINIGHDVPLTQSQGDIYTSFRLCGAHMITLMNFLSIIVLRNITLTLANMNNLSANGLHCFILNQISFIV